ncbi:U6 small nuclear RNA (adenine-(43)-N(6))-methyltransferase isoform X1 [Neodiprion virginianus]|uniref:U6 small nuclear RNA (adenine-(43)-N(6))-methyltransferase isoform X1 n=1 Tax=Neodiprion virginianus TaxID=2961670 RepID=UPI001EE6DA07|nr:U6 small nuclear RNA (adenine-(43)-N(6))-methyltransferase isoform X1 [Neodiprion virginianus]XP_046621904.1 U6 small nuclear RNA (adenine-(43)-N(6))-methyltransferase isoform X1 [Neodiprion virginianus]XP_046621905.1 U6 small nuclear RNA (adenine-(43)-N(6))-methyltransferase isoform X1 [Neodiprion virginianus]XP_046621906.1 U6 small nuclear RNA (adenine-(43)-N(6))-methyltransferase isoform X1 [Neodiprion virginianus]
MSLRRFMHPRNKYKQEPNFKQLAILYPEFRKIATTDLAGKVRINFHDLETLRILTKTLLKHDYDLNVDLPATKLVPAVPLRLNYVLWIEDLVKHAGITDMSLISGIDIGTGAVCVYPLLFAKIYGCRMIGTEVDLESYESAVRNVNSNNLHDLVEVIRVNRGTVLRGSVPENNVYTFTMCNPPFFCAEEDTATGSKPSGSRMPPRNAPSGSEAELVVEGGEIQFVLKMLNDSVELNNKIKIYTTMLGKKTSLTFLCNEFKKRNIENSTWTEFCQGHTTRWGLAWTFLSKDVLDLTTAPVIRISGCSKKLKQKAKRPPSEITFPVRDGMTETKELVLILRLLFNELKIRVEELHVNPQESSYWCCQLMADEDTWSHGRRKRRMMANQSLPSKRPCPDIFSENDSEKQEALDASFGDDSEREEKTTALPNGVNTQPVKGSFLICDLVVGEIEPNDNEKKLKISMIFESGSGGRNALETLRQYFINKLNVREFIKAQSSVKNKQRKRRVKLKKDKT